MSNRPRGHTRPQGHNVSRDMHRWFRGLDPLERVSSISTQNHLGEVDAIRLMYRDRKMAKSPGLFMINKDSRVEGRMPGDATPSSFHTSSMSVKDILRRQLHSRLNARHSGLESLDLAYSMTGKQRTSVESHSNHRWTSFLTFVSFRSFPDIFSMLLSYPPQQIRDAEARLESYVRLCDTKKFLDTVTISPKWVSSDEGVEAFLRTMKIVSRGGFLSRPCRAYWDAVNHRWEWEDPWWFERVGYTTLAMFICSRFELEMWKSYFASTSKDPRAENQTRRWISQPYAQVSSAMDPLRRSLTAVWRSLSFDERRKFVHLQVRKLVLNELMGSVSGEWNVREQKWLSDLLDLLSLSCRDSGVQLSLDSVMFSELMLVDDTALIELLYLSPLQRAGSHLDRVLRKIGHGLQCRQSERVAMNLIIAEERQTSKGSDALSKQRASSGKRHKKKSKKKNTVAPIEPKRRNTPSSTCTSSVSSLRSVSTTATSRTIEEESISQDPDTTSDGETADSVPTTLVHTDENDSVETDSAPWHPKRQLSEPIVHEDTRSANQSNEWTKPGAKKREKRRDSFPDPRSLERESEKDTAKAEPVRRGRESTGHKQNGENSSTFVARGSSESPRSSHAAQSHHKRSPQLAQQSPQLPQQLPQSLSQIQHQHHAHIQPTSSPPSAFTHQPPSLSVSKSPLPVNTRSHSGPPPSHPQLQSAPSTQPQQGPAHSPAQQLVSFNPALHTHSTTPSPPSLPLASQLQTSQHSQTLFSQIAQKPPSLQGEDETSLTLGAVGSLLHHAEPWHCFFSRDDTTSPSTPSHSHDQQAIPVSQQQSSILRGYTKEQLRKQEISLQARALTPHTGQSKSASNDQVPGIGILDVPPNNRARTRHSWNSSTFHSHIPDMHMSSSPQQSVFSAPASPTRTVVMSPHRESPTALYHHPSPHSKAAMLSPHSMSVPSSPVSFCGPLPPPLVPSSLSSHHVLRHPPPQDLRFSPSQPDLSAALFMARLHTDILHFTQSTKPSLADFRVRYQIVKDIETVVKSIWPEATTAIFGSFATGLSLPHSDIDLVIQHCPEQAFDANSRIDAQSLGNLAREFRAHREWCHRAMELPKASMPVLKLMVNPSQPLVPNGPVANTDPAFAGEFVSVDVSFQSRSCPHSGLETLTYVKSMLRTFPELEQIVLVLKNYLHLRKLNNPYTGGLSSYSLIILVIYFIQRYHASQPRHPDGRPAERLGEILFGFLDFFGNKVDFTAFPIVVSNTSGIVRMPRSCPVWIDNPLSPGTNVAGSSFAMWSVQQAFSEAFRILSHQLWQQQTRGYGLGGNGVVGGGEGNPLRALFDEKLWMQHGRTTAGAVGMMPHPPMWSRDKRDGSDQSHMCASGLRQDTPSIPVVPQFKRTRSQEQIQKAERTRRASGNKFEEV